MTETLLSHSRSAGGGRFAVAAGLVLLLLACKSPPRPEPAADDPNAFAKIRARLEALESKYGGGSCTMPEMDTIIRGLESLPESSPNKAEAGKLAAELKYKQRVALTITSGKNELLPRRPPEAPSYEPRRIEGARPEGAKALARAAAVKVGTKRAELLEAYGSCLERASWTRGQNGAPTTEMFHVVRECRGTLQPRIFMVANEAIDRIWPGDLDASLTE